MPNSITRMPGPKGGSVRPTFLVFLILLLAAHVPAATDQQVFNVLTLISQTVGGRPIANNDVVASYVATVLAVMHFNERNSSVLSVLSTLKGCNAQLNPVGGLYDDQVLSSVAMSQLIRILANDTVDFINGPLSADVSVQCENGHQGD
jgi:hypothetical protein